MKGLPVSREGIENILREIIAVDVGDGVTFEIQNNIRLFILPPATPEMNPIEQILEEIREKGFKLI